MERQDIDIVVTWVDGNDPAWQAERAGYLEEKGSKGDLRFRDWGLLRYWFRGIEKYAPWARRIYFVTWGHVPEWLNTDHPKLRVVKHADYIPAEYLPTYNSHTIELNLHRIEGLSEQFLYFNDDFFLTRETPAAYFFRDGLPCDCFGLTSLVFREGSLGRVYANDTCVINDHFPAGRTFKRQWRKMLSPKNGLRKVWKTLVLMACCKGYFPGFYHWHATFGFLKSTFGEVWAAEPRKLDRTCRSRFREMTNVGPTLIKDWQLASGRFVPRSAGGGKAFQLRNDVLGDACRAIERGTYHVVCVNDSRTIQDFESVRAAVQASFEKRLPEKSAFER